ncbi:YraN family protein [Thiomicrorhabdus aquaedulcis]|uniref:YraN family protein n=1 Tax=Thiomicrorhabdus aquaedulcis TaxID=2211106 RepID=UPI000FDAB570|nr:YraN family protein [Thiomicrorhabdus aquaedulcis]
MFNFLALGLAKEQQAKQWLNQQGIHIIAQNYRCKGGEIDLIGEHHTAHGHARLTFFEVKYRKNALHGHPAEFVTRTKQQRIIKCAQLFLLKHPQYTQHQMQFDVLTFLDQQTQPLWIQNAFSAF